MKPKLTLVGAGPGDPELISLKGIKALQKADVVLYDALVHPDLLEYVRPNCMCKFVGKRAGRHSMKQDQINQLIVSSAFSYGHVVRLKGGDPFIFGRGHEEMEYAQSLGIAVEVVPGISSVTSLPAIQKIPLTRRGLSESFWVVTATTKTGELSHDLSLAAQSTASIVILMGMRKLSEIVALFSLYGRANTPILIIQNGSLKEEKMCVSTIAEIEREAKCKQMGTPALMLIGDIVSLHKLYQQDSSFAFAS